jgi:hypothetical protein
MQQRVSEGVVSEEVIGLVNIPSPDTVVQKLR